MKRRQHIGHVHHANGSEELADAQQAKEQGVQWHVDDVGELRRFKKGLDRQAGGSHLDQRRDANGKIHIIHPELEEDTPRKSSKSRLIIEVGLNIMSL